MSSSSSTARPPARVLRGADGHTATSPHLLHLDLAPGGLARLDPDRIDVAVETGRAAGFDAGFAAGRAAGIDEARAEQAAVTEAHRARLAAMLQVAETAISGALDAVATAAETAAHATVDAAFAVAEAVVGRELVLATDPGRDAVSRALALSPDGVEVTVRLHPADAAPLLDDLPAGRALRVVADPAVAPGDCVAEAGWTTIDARIGTALDRVRAVLEAAG